MNRPRRKRHGAATAAGAALLAAAGSVALTRPALAQDEGPLIVGQTRQYEPFHIDRPNMALELIGRYSNDERGGGGAVNDNFQEILFSQTFYIDTTGYVLHPNFINLKLGGAFGLAESFFDANDTSGNDLSQIYNWDLSATLLPKSNYPFTVYSKREQQWINREFGPTLQNTTTQTGAVLEAKSKNLSSRFEISRLDETQEGLDRVEDFSLSRNFFTWHTTATPTINQVLNWDYTFSQIDETGGLNQSYDTNDATLRHDWKFGPKGRNSLTSTVAYFDQSGTTNLEIFRWDEVLRLQHTDNFETRYRYLYNDTTFSSSSRTRQRAAAEFTHKLYQSLVTTGRAGVENVDFSGGGNTFTTFADIRTDYTKKVPLGLLNLGLGFAFEQQDNSVMSEPVRVIDDPRTFSATDPQPILLVGRNINPASINITDPSGIILYRPGQDYVTTQLPDGIQIQRVVGGRIGPGDQVLVDYTLNPTGANTVTSNTFTFNARYEFTESFLRGLGFYGSYQKLDQSITADIPEEVVPNSYDDLILGADYRFWAVTLGAERQMHDSQVTPFDATRYYARLTHRLSLDTLLTMNAAFTNINYTDTRQTTDLYTVSASLQHQFTRRLSGVVTVLWRDENDTVNGSTRGLEEQAELRWEYRQTSLYMVIRNADLDSPQENTSFQLFQVGIRREF